jgi:hypothetical protein
MKTENNMEEVAAYFKVLSQYLPEGNDEKLKIMSGYPL